MPKTEHPLSIYVEDDLAKAIASKILSEMNQPREIVLREIITLVSEHPDRSKYAQSVRDKLQQKANLLNLN